MRYGPVRPTKRRIKPHICGGLLPMLIPCSSSPCLIRRSSTTTTTGSLTGWTRQVKDQAAGVKQTTQRGAA
jgi:hypothetical protein